MLIYLFTHSLSKNTLTYSYCNFATFCGSDSITTVQHSASGTLHKKFKTLSQAVPKAPKVCLCNNLIILVTLHCVSLSTYRGKRFVCTKSVQMQSRKKKPWSQKVIGIVLNDKVDNSLSALLNITFKRSESSME